MLAFFARNTIFLVEIVPLNEDEILEKKLEIILVKNTNSCMRTGGDIPRRTSVRACALGQTPDPHPRPREEYKYRTSKSN